MITPQFEVRQTDDDIVVIIRAPYAKISTDSEPEVHVDCYTVTFYSSPYYLRLTFPGELIYDESYEKNDAFGDPVVMSYDGETGCFTVNVRKAVKGEHFADLNMLTKLLARPHSQKNRRPVIEVLDEAKKTEEEEIHQLNEEYDNDGGGDGDDDEDDDDFYIEQNEDLSSALSGFKYGFANQRSGVISKIQSELWEVLDLKDPDSTPPKMRRELRIEDEVSLFSDDHYLADFYEDEVIKSLLCFETKWAQKKDEMQLNSGLGAIDDFTDDEKEVLLKLPRKEFILSAKESKCVVMGLIDILFAFAYNHRTTEGENTVSSGWTVCKLSSTLSWFDSFKNLEEVLQSSFRRSLCFPLHRNWQLSEKVFSDIKDIISLGKTSVLKCLLEVRHMLFDADQHYILNELYVSDYCVWIQSVKCSTLQKLSEDLNNVTIKKSDMDLDLEIIEEAGKLAVEEAEEPACLNSSDASSSSESNSESSSESGEDSSDDESSRVNSDDQVTNEHDNGNPDKDLITALTDIHISECQS